MALREEKGESIGPHQGRHLSNASAALNPWRLSDSSLGSLSLVLDFPMVTASPAQTDFPNTQAPGTSAEYIIQLKTMTTCSLGVKGDQRLLHADEQTRAPYKSLSKSGWALL